MMVGIKVQREDDLSAQALLWMGFEGKGAEEVKLGLKPGGVILFARNLDTDPDLGPARCHGLIWHLQHGQDRPLAVALDQEGGAVSRLKGWVGETPAFRRIFAQGGTEACRRWGVLWGQGLRLLGINVDFAPVADLWDGHVGTGMGDRCASEAPFPVALAAGAFLHGLESTGVRGCLKHFPGLGGTRVDSHRDLPELKDMSQLDRNLQPFRALSNPDRLVMVAHLKTPGTMGLPASLHRGSVAANPSGIQARWIPDDLEMGGCAQWSWKDRVRLCLEAGHEALLVCQTPAGIQACAEALEGQSEFLIDRALARFNRLRDHLPKAQPHFDSEAWHHWVHRVQREAEAFAG